MAEKNLFQKYAASNRLSWNARDLTGQKFVNFTVREFTGREGVYFLWRCDCSCGNVFVKSSKSILTHHDAHCGINENHSKWRDPEFIKERFRAYFTEGSPEECWEWAGPRDPNTDYGIFQAIDPNSRAAHRFSYRYYKGEIPEGLFICHHCDNPPCVNPNHLYAGTASQNMQDKHNRGRHWPFALTIDDVVDIRKRMSAGLRYGDMKAMAKEYCCDKSLLFLIRNGKIWKDVPWPDGHGPGKQPLLKGGKKNA